MSICIELPEKARDMAEVQGWNENSLLIFALQFINSKDGFMDEFVEYLEAVKDEEDYWILHDPNGGQS